ncbi:VIT domain-containing protein [Gammaproteobacteria bacterium]|nr:VIT domain-containing protein [Gammaproteobacteria bacterium]
MFTIQVFRCCRRLLVGTLLAATSYTVASGDEDRVAAPHFLDEGGSPSESLILSGTEVKARVDGTFARVSVEQIYHNRSSTPVNARYVFPGSTRSAVDGMSIRVGNHIARAEIKEKEAAVRIFSEARDQGKQAGLLQAHRPNVFSMDVANIRPGEKAIVNFSYSERLEAEAGFYRFIYPTVVGPRYDALSPPEQWNVNPYLTGAEEVGEATPSFAFDIELISPIPLQDLQSPSHDITTQWLAKGHARLALKASEKRADNRDVVVRYRLQGAAMISGVLNQRTDEGNYFLLMAEPPQRTTAALRVARDYTFVIDTSGSMNGFPLDTARHLFDQLLAGMRPDDRFNLLTFAGDSRWLSSTPIEATAANQKRAEDFLAEQRGGGGTELLSALKRAMKGVAPNSDRSHNLVILTDGYVTADNEAIALIRDQLGSANVFTFGIGRSVNRHLIEQLARAGRGEAFVALSPGEARSVGKRFVEYIDSPLLTGLTLHGEDVELLDVMPGALPDVLARRAVHAIGRYRITGSQPRLILKGHRADGVYRREFPLTHTMQSEANLPLLWARDAIENLSLDRTLSDKQRRAQTVALGLRHTLLTDYTAFVAVLDKAIVDPTRSRLAQQSLPLPEGVSPAALSDAHRHGVSPGPKAIQPQPDTVTDGMFVMALAANGARPMPEPPLWWLIVSLLGWALLRHRAAR